MRIKLPKTWKERRAWKLRVISLCFCLVSLSLAFALTRIQVAGLHELNSATAMQKVSDKLGLWSFLLYIPIVDGIAKAYPEAVVGIFGAFVIGGVATTTRRTWFHDRFLATFNHDVLRRVPRLDVEDSTGTTPFVQLKWVPGEVGPRREALDVLTGWCLGMARPSAEVEPKTRFSVAVLVGRAGSGKSRMAHEFARLLGRREVLGGASPEAGIVWRLGCYARRVTPFCHRRDDDPWDAGILLREDGEAFEYVCARLQTWRPRKPTIMLLDDPLAGWAAMARRALIEADTKKPFDHAVCLLVINQTVPSDLGFRFEPSSRTWFVDKSPAKPPPVLLPVEAWFTPQETVDVAFKSGARFPSIKAKAIVREHLHRVTRGNPLLVQLAVEQLVSGLDISRMEPDDFLRARAGRILLAFAHRGIHGESQLAALALATLVGGASRSQVEVAIKRIFVDPSPLPGASELQGCFPTEPFAIGGEARLPAVRPELVADAFVDRIVGEIGSDRAIALAEAAFRLDAAYVLRSLRRARPHDSPMTAALTGIDADRIEGLDAVDLAVALADVAAICQPDDRPLSTAESRDEALGRALVAIERLDATQKRVFCGRLAAICRIPADQAAQRQLRPTVVMRLLDAATDPDAACPVEAWLAIFHALKGRAQGDPGPIDRLAGAARLIDRRSFIEGLVEVVWATGHGWAFGYVPLWQALREAAAALPDPLLAGRLAVMARIQDPHAARDAADDLVRIAGQFPDDPIAVRGAAAGRRLEVFAWSQVLAGAQAIAAQSAADGVAAIASRFPDDASIAREAAEALRCEAYAWCNVPSGTKAEAARSAADDVAAIASRFADDASIAREAATARRYEAYAWCNVPSGTKAEAARSAADGAAAIASRFPDDASIAREAAEARRCEAYAWCQVPSGTKADAARSAADGVAAIASRFPDDASIAREAAEARRCEAYAWSEVPSGTKAEAARSAADGVAAIASRFADEASIAEEAKKACAFADLALAHFRKRSGNPGSAASAP